MKQPELGHKIAELRKAKNLTQEELVGKCHVSVRTIQRIEAGEVTPRIYTVKIILAALGEDIDTIITPTQNTMSKRNWIKELLLVSPDTPHKSEDNKNVLLMAAIGGIIYLVLEIIQTALDLTWLSDGFDTKGNVAYTLVAVSGLISFVFFMRGFILLGHLFENSLIKISAYMLMFATFALTLLDIYTLSYSSIEALYFPYGVASVIFGAIGLVFGIALIKLQDGMGELSRIAGFLEIALGCLLITVVLFFLAYVILIPATILEIILLFRGYEYLSKNNSNVAPSYQ